jgi:hypothetical protein
VQYFVSIENVPYFHWQVELLIESFKLLNLEDRLLVATTGCDKNLKNLSEHKQKYEHENFGVKKGLGQYNLFHSLFEVTKQKILEQPFAVLHPDMILIEPLREEISPGITFHRDVFGVSKQLRETTHGEERLLIGDTIIFSEVSPSFFECAIECFEELHMGNIGGRLSPRDMKRAAWIAAAKKNLQLKYTAVNCETSMPSHDLSMILHYKHGLKGKFSKSNYSKDISLDCHPYEAVKRIVRTPPIDIMRRIIGSYQKP